MAKNSPKERFGIAREKLVATENGQEATMYGPLRDLFVEVLGYPPSDVDIDRSGARGRPDLTVFAPGGAPGAKVAWIVLEAKDEHGACKTEAGRKALFAEKSKYITADTAWFVMVEPTILVARPADRGGDASTDIVVDYSRRYPHGHLRSVLGPQAAQSPRRVLYAPASDRSSTQSCSVSLQPSPSF